MAFHDRRYLVDVLLGDPHTLPLWHDNHWRTAAAALDPIVAAARDKAAVRSLQYEARKPVAFGRIGWNARGHHKWTWSDLEALQAQGRWFCSMEMWAPSWTICEREDRAPDVFASIHNEQSPGSAVSFNPVVLVAVAGDYATGQEQRSQLLRALRASVNPLLHVWKERPWGRSSGGGFTDAIQDLAFSGLFKPGQRHGGVPSPAIFAETWTLAAG